MLVAIAEMAMAGGVGAAIDMMDWMQPYTGFLFGEDQGRYIVTSSSAKQFEAQASTADVRWERIGTTGSSAIDVEFPDNTAMNFNLKITALREASDSFFRDWMEV